MSANNRWPDFRLASTLRSLMRSQPDETAEAKSGRQFGQKEDEKKPEVFVSGDLTTSRHDGAGAAMADVDSYSVAGSEASAGAGADEDFGAIEMFDSNAAPATFSSQVQAPIAIMADDAPLDSSATKSKRDKKDKRDKKRKSSQEGAAATSPVLEGDSSKKTRKSKRKSARDGEIPNSQVSQNEEVENAADTPWGQLQEEEAAAAAAASQTKKKRKLSDSVDGKGRKKQRSQDNDLEHDESHEAPSSNFLRKTRGRRDAPDHAIYEDNEPESDTQKSPTVAHLRRRSQSQEVRSRESSISPENRMDVDTGGAEERVQTDAGAVPDTDGEVERLAREAWNEHRSGQQALEERQNGGQGSEMTTDLYPQEPLNASLEGIAETDPSNAKTKRPRSTRKKAKPTYFEQDPVPDIAGDGEGNRDALGELPSPSAATPKRRRAKRAAKKESRGRKPKREKLSQSMRGGSVEDDLEHGQSRNRLNGYTQGRFTDAELARIAGAVDSFRNELDLTQHEVNQLIHAPGGTTAGETHAQLWSRIFAECPDRHRQKVINITRKKFHNFVARGTWTPEQDAELAELIQQYGTKWSHIAGLINRHPEDLRDRYRNYIVCGPNQRKDAWDEDEEARLTQHIIESMMVIDELRASQPSRPLLQKSYEELIDWQNISELMGRTRSRLQCITKWKALNIRTHGKDSLISSQPDSQISFRLEKARRQVIAMPVEERYRLVMAINANTVGTDGKIPWQRLVDKPFRNQWHRYTQMLLWRRLQRMVPNWETCSVRECAQYLLDQYQLTSDLPDVPDEQFDDHDEMQFLQAMQALNSASMPGTQSGDRSHLSEDFVMESDAEDDHAEANGDAATEGEEEAQEVQEAKMEIDPALAEAAQPSKKPAAGKRATLASRKRGRKSAPALQDPIEEAAQELPQQTQDQGSDIDVEQFRKKKTPSKFKSPRGKKGEQRQSSPVGDADSVMDDMADLPARVDAV